MAEGIEEAKGTKLIVRFEGKKCIHSRNCVLGLPEVFRANVEGPWIHPDSASEEAVVALAQACPSGAITYERLDGGAPESAPSVNVIRVRENGPLAVHAEVQLEGQPPAYRATLCRCGASKNKPYCDGSHTAAGFSATGEPPAKEADALAVRNGPLAITPRPNGPLLLEGNVEIVTGTGRIVSRNDKCALCRCGASNKKPFCDGTHNKIGFKTE
jgi:CDGSH-type Zn-finger protein/uncharacterized Fe-S cluster protein YjdI